MNNTDGAGGGAGAQHTERRFVNKERCWSLMWEACVGCWRPARGQLGQSSKGRGSQRITKQKHHTGVPLKRGVKEEREKESSKPQLEERREEKIPGGL